MPGRMLDSGVKSKPETKADFRKDDSDVSVQKMEGDIKLPKVELSRLCPLGTRLMFLWPALTCRRW